MHIGTGSQERGSFASDPTKTPAPVYGLLTQLKGCCTALKSFTFGTNVDQYEQWTPSRPLRVYVEWALFLFSIRKTLEHFKFEHKPTVFSPKIMCTNLIQYEYVDLNYLNVDFIETFHPISVASTWPCMMTLEINGYRPLSYSSKVSQGFRTALKSNIDNAEYNVHEIG